MANALDSVPVVQNEGKFIKFPVGESRVLKFISFQKVVADRATVDKGYADKEGNQLQLEFVDEATGKQKFYYAKDGSSKLIQELKKLPELVEGMILTITKTDEYNFSVAVGGVAATEPAKKADTPF